MGVEAVILPMALQPHNGRWMGGDIFVSFNRDAAKRLMALGHAAKLLG